MKNVDIVDEAIDVETAKVLLGAATAPALVGPSQLVGTFGPSRGFGLVFSRADREAAIAMVPAFASFFDLILDDTPLASRIERAFSSPGPGPNAFYANALVLDDGANVGPHIDGTLGPALGAEGRTPAWVSVVYLEVPPPPCGTLVLTRGPTLIRNVEPRARRRVTFAGDLGHEVLQHASSSSSSSMEPRRRVSLVCEHYVASDEEIERLGSPRIHSRSQGPVFPSAGRGRSFADVMRNQRTP